MRKVLSLLRINCSHQRSLEIRSAGVTRSVCETCGHMSFQIETGLSRVSVGNRRARQDLAKVAGL